MQDDDIEPIPMDKPGIFALEIKNEIVA